LEIISKWYFKPKIERWMNKQKFRKDAIAKLKHIKMHSYKRDRYIIDILYRYIKKIDARYIMLYVPLDIEVDIMPLIRQLRIDKRVLFVPFMEGESFRLVKYRLPLVTKQFGIKEPKYSKQKRRRSIDLSIVPIVGTDATLRRIGFGKGMYDRFFENEKKNIKNTIFISRILSISNQVITDHYDVEADMIITPEKILMRNRHKI